MAGSDVEFADVLDSTQVDIEVWKAVDRIGFPNGVGGSVPGGSESIWDYRYYADPELDRVVVIDPKVMRLVGWFPTIANGHPGSADRAGYTDRMYVRTTGPSTGRFHTYDVVNARTLQLIESIHLPDPDDPTNERIIHQV